MFTPVVLAADYAGTIQVSDRADVRVRATQTQGGVGAQQTQTGMDLDDQALVVLNADDRRWRFTLAYSPVITLENVQDGVNAQNEPQLLQTATGLAAWHSRATRLTLSEAVTYGHFNSAYQFQPGATSATTSPGQIPPPMTTTGGSATGAPTQTQLQPVPTDVYFGSTQTTLTLSQSIGQRSLVTIGGGYFAGGGLDETSRLVDPLAYGPRADASFSYVLSPTLRTVTSAHAEMTDFTASQCYTTDGLLIVGQAECRPESELATVAQGLRDSLTRSTTLSFDAGVSFTQFQVDANAPAVPQVFPAGDATLMHQFGERKLETLIVAVSGAPIVDVRTGHISYGVQGTVTWVHRLSPRVTIAVDAAGVQTFPTGDPLAYSIVRSDVEARFLPDRRGRLALVLGESELWQDQGTLGAFLSIYGYFGVTVATPALPF